MDKLISLAIIMSCFGFSCFAQDIALLPPNKTGGKPLMEALNERQSTRELSDKDLDIQTLSDLLWAAYGFNREDRRVVPSANNRQEFSVYAVLKTGVYLYDARENVLVQKAIGDFRAKTGWQEFVSVAPLNLVYVADLSNTSRDIAAIDCGYISENVYLFCASAGLGTVVRGSFSADEIRATFGLEDKQEPIITQTVGYRK
jgi:nitroreductase